MNLKIFELFLSKLCCPGCSGDLLLRVKTAEDEKIREGNVDCSICGVSYPIYDGVLELIQPSLQYHNADSPDFCVHKEQLAQRMHFDNWAESSGQDIDQFKDQGAMRVAQSENLKIMLSKMTAGKFLLDVGCGPGQEAVMLAKAGVYVAGFEMSRNLVKKAMKLAEKEGVADRTVFFVADAVALPCKANVWDYVTTLGVLHHVPLPGNVCVNIQKVLKPGGLHYFIENNKSLLRPIFDWMMKKYPLWEEEAGEDPLISEIMLRDWVKDIPNVELKVRYLFYLPPHFLNVIPFALTKFLYNASNTVLGAVPGVRKLGGCIAGELTKTEVYSGVKL